MAKFCPCSCWMPPNANFYTSLQFFCRLLGNSPKRIIVEAITWYRAGGISKNMGGVGQSSIQEFWSLKLKVQRKLFHREFVLISQGQRNQGGKGAKIRGQMSFRRPWRYYAALLLSASKNLYFELLSRPSISVILQNFFYHKSCWKHAV